MPVRTETRARALALQLLYAWDSPGTGDGAVPGPAWSRIMGLVQAGPLAEDHAFTMAQGVVEQRALLDAFIERAAERWRIDRLGVVERNVLRLAAWELNVGDTPPRVVIDEALRLAHWFGGGKSPSFVNGVLDRIARDLGRL